MSPSISPPVLRDELHDRDAFLVHGLGHGDALCVHGLDQVLGRGLALPRGQLVRAPRELGDRLELVQRVGDGRTDEQVLRHELGLPAGDVGGHLDHVGQRRREVRDAVLHRRDRREGAGARAVQEGPVLCAEAHDAAEVDVLDRVLVNELLDLDATLLEGLLADRELGQGMHLGLDPPCGLERHDLELAEVLVAAVALEQRAHLRREDPRLDERDHGVGAHPGRLHLGDAVDPPQERVAAHLRVLCSRFDLVSGLGDRPCREAHQVQDLAAQLAVRQLRTVEDLDRALRRLLREAAGEGDEGEQEDGAGAHHGVEIIRAPRAGFELGAAPRTWRTLRR